MRKLCLLLALLLPAAAFAASPGALTINLKAMTGDIPLSRSKVLIEISNCTGNWPKTSDGVSLLSEKTREFDGSSGTLVIQIYGNDQILCGVTTGTGGAGNRWRFTVTRDRNVVFGPVEYQLAIGSAPWTLSALTPITIFPPESFGGNATQIQSVNVDPTAPLNGQTLIYDSTSTKYKPQDPSATGNLSQNISFSGDISPTQITANQNDYTPTGLSTASTLRLNTDASRTITGLAGGADGRVLIIHNIGSFNIVLATQSSSSTAANRFAISTDITLTPDRSVALQYDATSARWRELSRPASAGVADPGANGLMNRTSLNTTAAAKAEDVASPVSCADAGGTDAYACSLSPAIAGYVTGTHYRFKANTANTGAATINLNALGAKTIKKVAGGITTDLADNDIRAGQWIDLVYDGTNMQMQSLLGNAAAGSGLADPGSNGVMTRSSLNTTAPAKTDDISAPEFCSDAGGSDTYACSLSPVVSAYTTGVHYRFKANTANTGPATINFNAIGAKTIKKAVGGVTTDLSDNDIRAGQWIDLVYDGTNMQIQSVLGNAATQGLADSGTNGPVTRTSLNTTAAAKADDLAGPIFCSDAGSTDAYACNLSPAITSYVTGAHYRFKANTANTGTASLNLNSLGAKTIKKVAGGITTDLTDNDIRVGQWIDLIYDGTNLQMQSLLGNAPAGSGLADPGSNGVMTRSSLNTTAQAKSEDMSAPVFCSDAGSTDAYACSLSPAITSYVTGTHYRFKANTANTGAASINLNSLGAKTIKKAAGGVTTDLSDNDIRAGQWVGLVYDGTNMQMVSPLGNASPGGITNNAAQYSFAYYSQTGSTNVLDGVAAPTANGLYQILFNVASGAAVAPTVNQLGLGGRAVTGATTSDTVLYSDVDTVLHHDQAATGTISPWTLPTPTTLGNTGFAVRFCNHSAQTDVITPTTWTIQAGTSAAASTLSLPPKVCASVKVDPNPSNTTNWVADLSSDGLKDPGANGLVNRSALNTTAPAKTDDVSAPVFCADAGSTDTYACSLSPAPAAYVTGTHYRFKANTANTAAATINFNSLGAKTIKKVAGGITTDLVDNDIRVGQWIDLIYDGTNMQMQSLLGNAPAGSGLADPGGNGVMTRSSLNTTAQATADNMSGPLFCQDAGSTDTYACSLSPAIAGYTTGTHYWFKANTVNTGAATINFNSLGAKTIKKRITTSITTDLSDNDIAAGSWQELVYDGTNMQMLSSPSGILDTARIPGFTGGDITSSPGSLTLTLGSNSKRRGISFSIGDPGGSALSAASTTTSYLTVPFSCTISAYNLLVDAGTITVKFWKVATGTAIPTSSNSINTSGVAISTGTAIHSATLTDFTSTTVSQNDIVAMNVTTVATAKYVNGVLECDQ